MAGKVLNIKVCSPLKLRSGLTVNYHAICHYSYNLPLPPSVKKKKKRQLCYIKTEERNEEINPHSGTFGFSQHKNQRNEKPKEPSFFHAPMPTHHPKLIYLKKLT